MPKPMYSATTEPTAIIVTRSTDGKTIRWDVPGLPQYNEETVRELKRNALRSAASLPDHNWG